MSTFSQLYYHIIFGTKNRVKCIDPSWSPELHKYMGGVVTGLGGRSLGVGGIEDHVHLLVSLKTNKNVSDLLRELKKSTVKWVREKQYVDQFLWQEGYGAFSVSPSSIEQVRSYIANQEEHHRQRGFIEEFQVYLEKSGIEYDPKYLP